MRTSQRPPVRLGRPPRTLAGEVDDRILDAAQEVFFERGLAGGSIDEIARLARAGKPTIYARFPTKMALFEAMAARNAAAIRAQLEEAAPAGTTVEERLVALGRRALERLLTEQSIAFIRLGIAEAKRFPELAHAARMARDHGVAAVVEVLRNVARGDGAAAYPAFREDRVDETSRFFADLIVARFVMRALAGEPLEAVRADLVQQVETRVRFFLSACRGQGGINH